MCKNTPQYVILIWICVLHRCDEDGICVIESEHKEEKQKRTSHFQTATSMPNSVHSIFSFAIHWIRMPRARFLRMQKSCLPCQSYEYSVRVIHKSWSLPMEFIFNANQFTLSLLPFHANIDIMGGKIRGIWCVAHFIQIVNNWNKL